MFTRKIFALLPLFFMGCDENTYKIDVVIPIEHVALNAIVEGFKTNLPKTIHNKKCVIKVHNAQGDPNTMRAILSRKQADLVVPITTTLTQMAFTILPNHKVLGLASLPLPSNAKSHVTLTDETPLDIQCDFLKMLQFKRYTLLHSINEKVYEDAKKLSQMAPNLTLKMVQNLSDVYSTVKTIHTDAVFILKDSTIASGIQTVLQHTEAPIISCDEGTVAQGAACALGVNEITIGAQGAVMAEKMLNGEAVESKVLDQLTVFVNPKACQQHNIDRDKLRQYALDHNYQYTEIS